MRTTKYEAFNKEKICTFNIPDHSPCQCMSLDLNFLKVINDTYGHEKGDISIKTICRIVCNVFDHSPVFRVGGDEFVVILMNEDLNNVGYAVYEKGVDNTADDVFERADANMYADKAAQKAQRN